MRAPGAVQLLRSAHAARRSRRAAPPLAHACLPSRSCSVQVLWHLAAGAAVRRHSPGDTGTCVHVPVALQTSAVQSFPSLVHAVPAGSSRQRSEQQSPSEWLPSSQFSRGSITPFPHLVAERGPLQALLLDVHVICVSSPSPVPLQARSAQSPGISPVTENAPVPGRMHGAGEGNWGGRRTEGTGAGQLKRGSSLEDAVR